MEPIEQIPNQQLPVNLPETPNRNIRFSTYLLSLFIVALISGGAVFLWSNYFSSISKSTPLPVPIASSSPTIIIEKNKSVLIYAEEISDVTNRDRSWATLRVFRIINNGEPEVLVPSIGQVGEYPSDFLLSPDKKSILVNLETKLVMIDLTTKEVKDVFKFDQGGNYRGLNYSPDGKKLFVWDQKYVSNVGNYSVYTYDFSTKEKTILKSGSTNSGSMVVLKWRNDNKVILAESKGGFAELWVFDLNNNTLVKKEGGAYQLNESGMLMAAPYSTVNDPCNEMSGTATGGYKLTDPATLAIKDQIDGNGKTVSVLAMSPQGDQVIYSISDLIDPKKVKDISDCNSLSLTQESSRQFFLKKLNEFPSQITNYKDYLKKWGIQNGEAIMQRYPDHMNSYIQNGTQKITGATEKSQLQIVAQFLQ